MRECLCQKAFKRRCLVIALSAMFTVNSSVLLADDYAEDATASAATRSSSGAPASSTKVMGFKMDDNGLDFPAWPEKTAVAKDVPPPPPLGPYMSTALNNEQAGLPRFKSMVSIPVPDFEGTPMTTFSPDLPWPDDTADVNRWVPAKGYNFVAPNVRQAQPVYNQGQNRGNARVSSMEAQRQQQGSYSRRPMPAPVYKNAAQNRGIQNRAMYNAPVTRPPNANSPMSNYPVSNYRNFNPAANYHAPVNQQRINPSLQQRHLSVNRNNGFRPYPNGMGQSPQVNTGYNRPVYGAPPQSQMVSPSGSYQR